MALERIADFERELDSLRAFVRENGILEGTAAIAGSIAANLRRAAWKDHVKAEARALADKFDRISHYHREHTANNWEAVPADKVPAELLS